MPRRCIVGRLLIRHNDEPEAMEEIARSIFGNSAIITSNDGSHGEVETYVSKDGLTPHAIPDLERMEFVISAEML